MRSVEKLLSHFQQPGCNMSIKVHSVHSNFDRFPNNLGGLSYEQGEGFHHDTSTMEERYQGVWDAHVIADHCWNNKIALVNHIKQENPVKYFFDD